MQSTTLDAVRARHEAEQAAQRKRDAEKIAKGGTPSNAFSGGHRLARMYKFAGQQSRKAETAKSRKKMRKQSQRRNRGRA